MRIDTKPNGLIYISRRFVREGQSWGQLAADFQLYSPGSPSIGNVNAFRDIAHVPGENSMWQFLQQCLSRCLETHSKCQASQNTGWLPKRLLLLIREYSGLEKVRLINTPGHTGLGRYIALSYCWGNSPTLLATRNTLARLQDGISTSDLPSTMRDCTTVATKLGVSLVWIDSLCIMQDDREDWARHSQQMGQIYENALFMVAACSSHDSSMPFLGRHAPSERLDSVSFSLKGAGRKYSHIRTRDVNKIRLSFLEGPLEWRGWAWQERKLSKRKINFMAMQTVWQCEEAEFHEHGMIRDTDRTPQSVEAAPPLSDEDLSADGWYWSMTDFAKRQLTYATDRLPAVSGMAARFLAVRKCEYYAGLWADDFPYCLGWFCDGQVDSDHPRDWETALHNGVPSRSWASVGAKVSWPHLRTNYENKNRVVKETTQICERAQLIEARCEPATGNAFGEVLPGSYLKVRGKVIEAVLECDGNGHGLIRRDGFEPQLVVPDCLLTPTIDDPATQDPQTPMAMKRADNQGPTRSPGNRLEGSVLCMLLYSLYDHGEGGNQAFVLVLSESGKGGKSYERVAAGMCYWGPVYSSRQRWRQWEGWTGLQQWEKFDDWFADAETMDLCIV